MWRFLVDALAIAIRPITGGRWYFMLTLLIPGIERRKACDPFLAVRIQAKPPWRRVFTEKSDLVLRVTSVSANNTSVNGGYDLLLVKN